VHEPKLHEPKAHKLKASEISLKILPPLHNRCAAGDFFIGKKRRGETKAAIFLPLRTVILALKKEERGLTVWVEYVLIENFAVDISLLFLAAKTVRLPVSPLRLCLASLMGACFALFFPLLPLTGVLSLLVRLSFGVLLCLVGVKAKGKTLLFVCLFFLYTFAYGGLLTGIYAFLEIEYTENGFIFAQTPAGAAIACLPFFVIITLCVTATVRKKLQKRRLRYACKITRRGKNVTTYGLLDTGNSLSFRGEPVCLLDGKIAEELGCGEEGREGQMLVKTATGEGVMDVFSAEIEIYSEGERNILNRVYFAAGGSLGGGYGVILQPQLFKEDCFAQGMVGENLHVFKKTKK
jgi:hypothetical protein